MIAVAMTVELTTEITPVAMRAVALTPAVAEAIGGSAY